MATTRKPETFAAQHAVEHELRQTIASLGRQLAQAKHRQAELVAAVDRAVRETVSGLVLPPVKVPSPPGGPHDPQVVAITLGDVQLGRRTRSYSTAIAERRICELYVDKIAHLVNVERADHKVDAARVYLLGDIVDGELIFPGQAHMIDASLYRQVCQDGPRILTTFLRRLLAMFKRVHVVAVVGNHGELGGHGRRRDHNPETNADRMVYAITQQLLANEKRLTWHIPWIENDRAWYGVDYPCGDGTPGVLVMHGERVRVSATAATATIAKKLWGLKGAIPEPFQYAVWGHYTSPARYYLNRVVGFCNGGVESSNVYAQEEFQSDGQPQQLMLFFHPRIGITGERWVMLDGATHE